MLEFFQLTYGCPWYSQISNGAHGWDPLHARKSMNMRVIQCSLAVPNIKYNFVVLFLSQLYCLFIYVSKYIFPYKKVLIDVHTKIWTEISDIVD